MEDTILYIVVPCYNEEEVLPETTKRLNAKMQTLLEAKKISPKSRVIYVNDGSRDKTWSMIQDIHKENPLFGGVGLSRNYGHQNALLAGLTYATGRCDVSISMDADLQDDINAIDAMLDAYFEGNEVVYGVRSSRKKDSFLKRFEAESFYKMMKHMGVETVFNHADFRLMGKKALAALAEFQEENVYLRGIVPRIGYKHTTVEYERDERFAGESKYPLKKMLGLATDGITSFSLKPLHMIFFAGLLLSCLGFVAFITLMILMYCHLIGMFWPIITFGIFGLGLILTAIGIVGAYVGRTHLETKRRPRYIVDETLE